MKIRVSNATCYDIADEIYTKFIGDYTVRDFIMAISEKYTMEDLITTPNTMCVEYIKDIVKTALENKLGKINIEEMVI